MRIGLPHVAPGSTFHVMSHKPNLLWGIALSVTLLTAACGKNDGEAQVAVATATSGSTVSGAVEPEPEPESESEPDAEDPYRGRTVTFTYESDEGWTYAGDFGLPVASADFIKDIASSPPGTARITGSVAVPLDDPAFDTTNPGRPNGPSLTPEITVIYEVNDDAPNLRGRQCRVETGIRSAAGDGTYYVPEGFYKVPFEGANVICRTNPPQDRPETLTTEDTPEAAVDDFIATIEAEEPVTEIELGDCVFFIYPDNRVVAADYQHNAEKPFECPGSIKVTNN